MAKIFTDETFQSEVLASDVPVLVDFYADWCGPCKMLAPVVEELAEEYQGKVIVGKVNVDHSPKTAQQYGVMSIPTVILFKNGKPVNQIVGFQSKNNLKAMLDA